MGQIIEYSEIEAKLSTITNDGEATKMNLEGINRLIESAVGPDGYAWSGEAATAFKNSWDELAAGIPDFITTVQNQAANIQSMLTKTKETDTTAGGTVNIGANITSGSN